MRPSPMLRVASAVLLLGSVFTFAGTIAPRDAAAALNLRTWQPVTDGIWGLAGNWNPATIPGAGDSAVVSVGMNGHRVSLETSYSVGSLNVVGPGAIFDPAGFSFSSSLFLNSGILRPSVSGSAINGFYHSLAGAQTEVGDGLYMIPPMSWQNDGHAVVHSTAGASASELRVSNYATYSGTGDILLNDATNAQITSPNGYTLTQSAGHLIHGAGRITLGFTNHGTVTADLATNANLSIEAASTNDGFYRSANGAHLVLSNTVVNAGGTLFADGGDVQLNGAAVSNGILRTTNSNVVETIAGSQMSGSITNAGAVRVNSGTVLNLGAGTFTDSGSVLVRQNGGVTAAALRLNGYATVAGPGDIKLNDPALAAIDSPTGYSLTHNSGHSIHGAGKISLLMINHGLISADVFGQTLTESNGVTTDGTLDARNGGTLLLQNATVTNTGTISADGGNVLLDNTSISGGTLTRFGSSVIAVTTTASMTNLTNTGVVQVNGGSLLNLTGSTLTNSGNLLVKQPAGVGTATLRMNGYVTFSGAGAVQLASASQAVFDSPGGWIATQSAGHSIHGTGTISTQITNHGLVSADVNGQTLLESNVITNDGVLQATGGGIYVLSAASVNNAGGTIRANGGTVQLNGSSVTNGTLARTGASVVEVTGNSTMNGVNNTGFLRVDSGKELSLIGSVFTNSGTVQIREPAGSAAADIRVDGYVTLGGNGTWQLTHPTQSSIVSPGAWILTQASTHTIQGAGTTTLALTNHGLVNANAPGLALTMSNNIDNDGVLKASNGGTLVLAGASVSNTGTVLAGGGDVILSNSGVTNSVLASTGGNKVVAKDVNTFANVNNKALVQVNGSSYVNLVGGVFNDSGTVVVRDTTAGPAELRVNAYLTMLGNGLVRLAHRTDARITSPGGYILTQAAGHSIRGTGVISSLFTNQGDVWADQADSLAITNSMSSSGRLAASNGGSLQLLAGLTNYAGNQLSGGGWQVAANSELRIPGAAIVTDAADILLEGHGSRFTSSTAGGNALAGLNHIVTGASFTLRNDRDFAAAGSLLNDGTLVLGDSADFTISSGVGQTYTQASTGRLVIELAGHGTNRCGHLVVPGAASFGGSLTVRLANGFVPALGDSFLVIDFGSRDAGFTTRDSLNVSPGIYEAPIWHDHQLWLRTVNNPSVGVESGPGGPVAQLPKVLRFEARSGVGRQSELQLELPRNAGVEVALFDIGGRRVATLASGALAAGRHAWSLNSIENAAAGVYFGRAWVTAEDGISVLNARVVMWR